MNKVPIEALIASSYVRYDTLGPLISNAFRGSTATEVNMYIDLYSIMKSLYGDGYVVDIKDDKSFTASIINMCAHYREWFRFNLGVYVKIFIIHSFNCPEINNKFVCNYNSSMKRKVEINKSMTDFINYNSELLETLCPYLPDIHYIKTDFESAVVTSFIIDKEVASGNINPNIILTKDLYNIQLLLHPSTVILRSRKFKGEDSSFLVGPLGTPQSIVDFWNFYGSKDNLKNDCIYINPMNVSLLMAINKLECRGLPAIINVNTAKKAILKAVGTEGIPCSVESLLIANPGIEEKISRVILESRFKSIDLQFQKSIFVTSTEAMLLKYKNLNDPTAVKAINDKYFTLSPIHLDRL